MLYRFKVIICYHTAKIKAVMYFSTIAAERQPGGVRHAFVSRESELLFALLQRVPPMTARRQRSPQRSDRAFKPKRNSPSQTNSRAERKPSDAPGRAADCPSSLPIRLGYLFPSLSVPMPCPIRQRGRSLIRSELPKRIAAYPGVRRNVAMNDRPGGHHRAVADRHSRQNRDVRADHDPVADAHIP